MHLDQKGGGKGIEVEKLDRLTGHVFYPPPNDLEMVRHCSWKNVDKLPNLYHYMTDRAYAQQNIKEPYINKPITRDSYKMGMWVGAAIDDLLHCAMLFDYTSWSKKN